MAEQSDSARFPRQLSQLRAALDDENCVFVSFDLEFSGLERAGSPEGTRRASPLAPPAERYRRTRACSSDFTTLQVGFCVFSKCTSDASTLVAQPFSFHCFPSRDNWSSADATVLLQLSSCSFLARNGFDFNAAIRNGVTYMSLFDEGRVRTGFAEKLRRVADRRHRGDRAVPNRKSDIDWLEEVRQKCRSIIKIAAGTNTKSGAGASVGADAKCDTGEPNESAFQVTPQNGYQRLLVYQLIEYEFPNLTIKKLPNAAREWLPHMLITALTAEQAEAAKVAARAKKLSDFSARMREAVGLRAAFEAIHISGRPLVGHNCFMDLIRLCQDFIIPLPTHFVHFKHAMHTVFPTIFDTKFLLTQDRFKGLGVTSTTLADAYRALETLGSDAKASQEAKDAAAAAPRIQLADPALKRQEHDASYDAYLTGSIFAKLMSNRDSSGNITLDTDFCANRVSLYSSYTHMYLAGDDPYAEDLANTFYISRNELLWNATRARGGLTDDGSSAYPSPNPNTDLPEAADQWFRQACYADSVASNRPLPSRGTTPGASLDGSENKTVSPVPPSAPTDGDGLLSVLVQALPSRDAAREAVVRLMEKDQAGVNRPLKITMERARKIVTNLRGASAPFYVCPLADAAGIIWDAGAAPRSSSRGSPAGRDWPEDVRPVATARFGDCFGHFEAKAADQVARSSDALRGDGAVSPQDEQLASGSKRKADGDNDAGLSASPADQGRSSKRARVATT